MHLLPPQWTGWTGVSLFVRRSPALFKLLGLYVCPWLIAGAGHWCLANALGPTPPRAIFLLIAATALSWGIGVLAFVAPAGLGVREGILYLFVRNIIGDADALVFVAMSRLLAFGVEALLTATWGVRTLWRRGR